MVPISLRLRNFLCYRDNAPPISFTGFRTACLSGSNGHGKSALLDALCWALWGEARAKSAEDLVHHGQAEMEVDFEFGMGEDRYRVVRKYSRPKTRTGAGQTVLEVQVEHDGQYRAITGNTVRESEQKIAAILRLDYDTFINSSCLLQGRADEFTNKRPGERKRILTEILGLSYYDELEERAKDQVRAWQRSIQTLEGELAAIDAEVALRDGLMAEEGRIAGELARQELEQRTGAAELQAALEARRARDLERRRLAETEQRLEELTKDLGRLQGEAGRARGKIAEHEALIARAAAIEEAFKAWASVRSEIADLDVRQADHQKLEADRIKQLHAIDLARQALESQVRTAEQTAARYRPRVEKIPALQARLDQLAQAEARHEAATAELEALRGRHLALVQQRQTHQDEKDRLRTEMEDLRKKVDLLAGQADGLCPLCGHTLGAAGQNHLREVTKQDGLQKKQKYREHELTAKRIDGEAQQLATEIDRRGQQIAADRNAAQTERGKLTAQIAQAQEARGEVDRAEAQIAAGRAALAAAGFAAEARSRLTAIETRLAALSYRPEVHQALRTRLAELASAERDQWALERARQEVGPEREALGRHEAASADRQKAIAADQEAIAAIRVALAEYRDLDTTIAEREDRTRRIDQAVAQTREQLGGIRQQLQAAATQAARRPSKEQELTRARLEKDLHDHLVTAFGKRGIQAMIIDAVLPEIEQEANGLLARMTDNRMHLTLDTQRESRRGSAIETLDIKVADELGTRPYELFSGGEAFRINFAVRIALSRLLARRAGARLQTLIIDEGFGTQDASGREKLIDAINSVEPDFEKILVITHVDELKDLFNTRIDVVKNELGSIATVV